MIATGIVRRTDDLGRVMIPREIRRQIGIAENTPLEIFITKDKEIILKKYDGNYFSCFKDRINELNEAFADNEWNMPQEIKEVIAKHIDALIAVSRSIKEDVD